VRGLWNIEFILTFNPKSANSRLALDKSTAADVPRMNIDQRDCGDARL
jgi:hypothetical protein